ncbi:MAG TPA: hypothetical protein VGT78_04855 [Rhizomicrobium sp.]|nr:hypothetical protein [Rhizomicrobium sp.]
MRIALGASSIALAAMVAGAAAAAPLKCAKPDEVTAIQASVIQQQLMVAALTCNQITSFNAFQTGFGVELRSSDGVMEKMFKRVYGTADGEAAYHAFKTRMANDSSIRSIHDNANYCKEAETVFAAALSPDKPTLAAFVSATKVSEQSPVDTCDLGAVQSASAEPGFIVPKPNPLRTALLAPDEPIPARTTMASAPVATPVNNPVTATTPLVAPAAANQPAPVATAAAAQTAAPAATPAGVLPDVVPDAPTNTASATPPAKKSGWLSGVF